MNSKVTGEGGAAEEVKKNHCNFRLVTVSFQQRDENKTCSACREWLNERLKVVKVVKVAKVVKAKKCESDVGAYENKSCSACRDLSP